MIEQNVRVESIHDDRILVRLGGTAGCSACDSGRGCGAGLFSKLFRRKPVLLELPGNGSAVQTGQMLVLGIPESVFVRLVLTSYAWPLLAGLAGAALGHTLSGLAGFEIVYMDLAAMTGGVLAAWILLRLIAKQNRSGRLQSCLQGLDYFPAARAGTCQRQP